jgi:hypothetical protein
MAATSPVDSVCSSRTTRCFLLSPALHCIHNWALLSSPRLGESSLVGIDLQPTIGILSWNKKDGGAVARVLAVARVAAMVRTGARAVARARVVAVAVVMAVAVAVAVKMAAVAAAAL